jgi:large subunit ribosomal protein L21
MYAVVETGGKQYRVESGDFLQVEKLQADEGSEVTLDKVLAVVDGGKTVLGKPYLDGASVTAEVVGSGKDKKVVIFKHKTRKGYRRHRGHRQDFTTLKIKDIKGGK